MKSDISYSIDLSCICIIILFNNEVFVVKYKIIINNNILKRIYKVS